jgi:hypothetical protein
MQPAPWVALKMHERSQMLRGGDEKETERETDDMKEQTKVRSEVKISFVQEVAKIHLLFVFVERSLCS